MPKHVDIILYDFLNATKLWFSQMCKRASDYCFQWRRNMGDGDISLNNLVGDSIANVPHRHFD